MAGNQQKGSIPANFIELLLARSDLVQVIGQRIPLKKAGSRYKACCPFHNEKTPSFNVNAQDQYYHCFGCGAHGDAINFLKEYDGLSFVEAVETLAALSGLQVPYEQKSPKQAEQQQKAQTLYDVMHQVAKFYRQQLASHPKSEQVKGYLKQRGLTGEIAKTFVIGYAPDGWDVLQKGIAASPQVMDLLVDCGMLIKKDDGRAYDRFRDRIMFPIRDGRGRVIAFGGRVMDSGQPKYLNSPETAIFHKSHTLYGLYEMRQARLSAQQILVVEGYMDVVALAQFGVRNVVATLGTAITASHLELLFKEVSEVVFCFDGDSAGTKAAWKALELSLPVVEGARSVRFLFLAEGEDPDSTIRQEGKAGFEARMAQALSLSDFLFKGLIGQLSFPVSTLEGQQQLIGLLKPYVMQTTGAMPDLLVNALADLVPIPAWRLGQILGVRVASTKKVQDSRYATQPPTLSKVTSGVLKLMRILRLRPYWVMAIPELVVTELAASANKEYQFLAKFIAVLQQNNCLIDSVQAWMMQMGYQTIWQQLMAGELMDSDEFLNSEFDFWLMNLATNLKEQQLKQTNLDTAGLEQLQALLKNKKT